MVSVAAGGRFHHSINACGSCQAGVVAGSLMLVHGISRAPNFDLKSRPMPGPQNAKKQKKAQQKREKMNGTVSGTGMASGASSSRLVRETDNRLDLTELLGGASPSPSPSPELTTPGIDPFIEDTRLIDPVKFELEDQEPPGPFLHDPGNGIRVTNIFAFLASPLMQPPSMDDEECAQFAQPDILSILLTMLPKELALVS